jgi:hypothetical protein
MRPTCPHEVKVGIEVSNLDRKGSEYSSQHCYDYFLNAEVGKVILESNTDEISSSIFHFFSKKVTPLKHQMRPF